MSSLNPSQEQQSSAMLPWYMSSRMRKEQRRTPDGRLEWGYSYDNVPDYLLHDSPNLSYSDISRREREKEKYRKRIEVYPVWKIIESQERSIRAGKLGIAWPRSDTGTAAKTYRGPLCPSSFPSQWPTVPYSYRCRRLKYLIPIQALPSRITVHDPWNILAVTSQNIFGLAQEFVASDTPGQSTWMNMEDKVHRYRLQIFDEKLRKAREPYGDVDGSQKIAQEIMDKLSTLGTLGDGIVIHWTSAEEFHSEDVQFFHDGERIDVPPSTGFFLHPPTKPKTDSSLQRIPPPIYVVHFPPPQSSLDGLWDQENVNDIGPLGEETHVYFSPEKISGTGHHSKAYKVEWEIPRSTIFPSTDDDIEAKNKKGPILCKECVMEDASRQLKEMAGWSDDGEADKGGIMRRVAKKFDSNTEDLGEEGTRALRGGENSEGDSTNMPPSSPCSYEYTGPLRVILSTVKYQHPLRPTCPHLSPLQPCTSPSPQRVPPTTKVRVLAKLSMPTSLTSDHAKHLRREAGCYERFYEAGDNGCGDGQGGLRMWGHWDWTGHESGDTVKTQRKPQFDNHDEEDESGTGEGQDLADHRIEGSDESSNVSELEDATGDIQVGAIVPRYYGYWVHDEECACGEPGTAEKGYFSDILLMENCGDPVENKTLTSEEIDEIVSLFKRFHSLGWTHGSPYARNIVWQFGPINRPIEDRMTDKHNRKLSFRLIDFGRSVYHEGIDSDNEVTDNVINSTGNLKRKRWESECEEEDRLVRKEFEHATGSLRVMVGR